MTEQIDIILTSDEAYVTVLALDFYVARKAYLRQYPKTAGSAAGKIREAIAQAFRVSADRKAVDDARL